MNARANIFARLKAAPTTPVVEPDTAAYFEKFATKADRITLLRHWASMMRSVKTEIIWTTQAHWTDALKTQISQRQIQNFLVPNSSLGDMASAALSTQATQATDVWRFDKPIEEWKEALFNKIDASITDCLCGIAKTGTLVLWPNAAAPRSMSLVPPTHFILFDTSTLYPDFFSAMSGLNWEKGMPTNAVLVSGPSKTADIQLTLAYGAHGPKDVIVFACLPDDISPADLEDAQ
ncbi:lactate utilization protein C [Leeia sp. TBRC 13508]|uniref:Lactate utilization protein C n=1 Tax=Leeia speluncae TaxID=2884804 RepID=A0ABS8D9I8_9NEIS|nr:lactate utilization protein C [Leeia speluncae]MCB6184874.1 lactate utilization protein C [Leeia speluncae]